MNFVRFSSLAAVAILGSSASASATVMLPLSLEQLTQEADAVVRGKVVDQVSAWDERHERIYTTTTLEVLDPIQGAAKLEKRIQVRSLGGEVNGIGMAVAGSPKFVIAEEALLFLRRDPQVQVAFQVIGMNQGRFTIERQPSGPAMAVSSLEGIAVAKPGTDGVLRVDPNHEGPQRIPLEDLRRRILSIGSRASGQAPAATPATPAVPAKLPVAPSSTPR